MTLTQDEIIAGDKLIAAFMEKHVAEFQYKEFKSTVLCDANGDFDFSEICYYEPHSDFNILMAAVEKIEALNYKFQICRRRVDIIEDGGGKLLLIEKQNTKRESIWCAVVAFIKLYYPAWYEKFKDKL